MEPATGITIIEGTKSKKGSFNFFREFHKYSQKDYESMMKNTLSNMSGTKKSLVEGNDSKPVKLPLISEQTMSKENNIPRKESKVFKGNKQIPIMKAIDSLKLISDKDEEEARKLGVAEDIFKKKPEQAEDKSQQPSEAVNTFNYTILSNKEWGQSYNRKGTGYRPFFKKKLPQ